MRKHSLLVTVLVFAVAGSDAVTTNAPSAAPQVKLSNASVILDTAITQIANNAPWESYAMYLDYPDAGVPDCGMFIESYSITKSQVTKNQAQVAVKFVVKGEFAGVNYYLYPYPIIRTVDYAMVLNNRNWKVVTDESGITNYIQQSTPQPQWKIHSGDIRFLNQKYFKWHMQYYNQDQKFNLIHQQPLAHCWN